MFKSPKKEKKPKKNEAKLLTEFLKSPLEFQTKDKFKAIFNSYSKSGSQVLSETESLGITCLILMRFVCIVWTKF